MTAEEMFEKLGFEKYESLFAIDACKGEVVDKFMEDEVIELVKKSEGSDDAERIH